MPTVSCSSSPSLKRTVISQNVGSVLMEWNSRHKIGNTTNSENNAPIKRRPSRHDLQKKSKRNHLVQVRGKGTRGKDADKYGEKIEEIDTKNTLIKILPHRS